MSEESKQCPYCKETINAEAKKCSHCGEILDPTLREIEMLKKQAQAGPTIVNNNNNNNNIGGIPANYATKSRVVYILLALFFGGLGIHNFYAGRAGAGVAQLLISLCLGWLVVPLFIVGLWVLIEIFVVTTDGHGVRFG